MTRLQADHRRLRQGFTLLEMVIVITIILILISLTTVVFAAAMGVARQRSTEATIMKIHGLIQQRIEALNRALDRTNLTPAKNKLKKDLGVTSALNDKAYEILTRKQIYQNRFPQSFYELRDIASITSTANFTFSTPNHKKETESAALLYWILTRSEVYGIPPVDESEFTSREVKDTDNDGLLEFVDGWGHPLRFYRWPTNLFRPGDGSTVAAGVSATSPITFAPIDRTFASKVWSGLPAAPASGSPSGADTLAHDPDDPTGELKRLVLSYTGTTSIQVMTMLQNRFHTPDTYHAFLIMSAGPDNTLGFSEPYDFGTVADATSPIVPANGDPDGYDNSSNIYPLLSSKPALLTMTPPQGRLASLLNYSTTTDNPITDNVTNRKR